MLYIVDGSQNSQVSVNINLDDINRMLVDRSDLDYVKYGHIGFPFRPDIVLEVFIMNFSLF